VLDPLEEWDAIAVVRPEDADLDSRGDKVGGWNAWMLLC
jgi:hypothetical protein